MPRSEEEIQTAERNLGVAFDAGLRTYLRCFGILVFHSNEDLLGMNRFTHSDSESDDLEYLTPRLRICCGLPMHVLPVAESGAGWYYVVDYRPDQFPFGAIRGWDCSGPVSDWIEAESFIEFLASEIEGQIRRADLG